MKIFNKIVVTLFFVWAIVVSFICILSAFIVEGVGVGLIVIPPFLLIVYWAVWIIVAVIKDDF